MRHLLVPVICLLFLCAGAGTTDADQVPAGKKREALHKLQLGDAFLGQGAMEKAGEFYRWAAKLAPDWWMVHHRLARFAELTKAPVTVIAGHYEKALKGAPDLYDLHMGAGCFHQAQGAWKLAERHLSIAARVGGRTAAPWIRLARVRLELNDRPGANKALARALDLEPDSIWGWHHRSELCRESRDIACEEKALRQLIRLAPDPAPYAARLGQIFNKTDRKQAARALSRWLRGPRIGRPTLPNSSERGTSK